MGNHDGGELSRGEDDGVTVSGRKDASSSLACPKATDEGASPTSQV